MARQFTDVLGDLGRGQTHEDLTAKLTEVVQAVQQTGKVGSLTLTLKIKPNGEHAVMVVDEIKSKVPEGTRGEALFFTTADGSLLRTDPRQSEMFKPQAVKEAV